MVKALAVSIELLFAPIIVKTQQARRLLLYVLTITVVLMLGSLRGWPQAPPSGEPTVLGVEVNLPDRAVFYIPVVGDGEILGIDFHCGRTHVGCDADACKGAFGKRDEVSALAAAKKKLSEATCEEVRSWKSEGAGTYEGKKTNHWCSRGWAGLVCLFSW
jgi:hypothetical protein